VDALCYDGSDLGTDGCWLTCDYNGNSIGDE